MRSRILEETVNTWDEAKQRKDELKKEHPDCEVTFEHSRQDSLYHVRVYEDDRTGEDVE